MGVSSDRINRIGRMENVEIVPQIVDPAKEL